jgi:hypothetical protein
MQAKKSVLFFLLVLALPPCFNSALAQVRISINILPAEPFIQRPPQPTTNHVWIEGEWVWQNGGYVWKTGYWFQRDPHKVWVRGYWHQRQDGGWFWVDGYWEWV